MAVALQDAPPSLVEMIRTLNHFSASERLLLAKALLDSLVTDEQSITEILVPIIEYSSAEDKAVERERQAFIALHPTLRQQYPNEHVAIHDGVLVDHDKDALALSLRIYQRFPDEFVWLAPLKEQAMEEWVMRSPRFEPITE